MQTEVPEVRDATMVHRRVLLTFVSRHSKDSKHFLLTHSDVCSKTIEALCVVRQESSEQVRSYLGRRANCPMKCQTSGSSEESCRKRSTRYGVCFPETSVTLTYFRSYESITRSYSTTNPNAQRKHPLQAAQRCHLVLGVHRPHDHHAA